MENRITGADVGLGILAYLPILNLIPLLKRKKNRFVLFHARQGLYLFNTFIVLFVVLMGVYAAFHWGMPNDFVERLVAVLLLFSVIVYGVLEVLMIGAVVQKRLKMLPVLGEFAGER